MHYIILIDKDGKEIASVVYGYMNSQVIFFFRVMGCFGQSVGASDSGEDMSEFSIEDLYLARDVFVRLHLAEEINEEAGINNSDDRKRQVIHECRDVFVDLYALVDMNYEEKAGDIDFDGRARRFLSECIRYCKCNNCNARILYC